MHYYAALDVSLRSVSICIVDEQGTICFEGKASSEIDDTIECIWAFDTDIRSIGFETGTLTQYLTYGLQTAGFDVICLEAPDKSALLSPQCATKQIRMMHVAWPRYCAPAGIVVCMLKALKAT